MKTKEPCIAVIGSGYWGQNLVRNFHTIGNLRWICDKNQEVRKNFEKQYPNVETTGDCAKVLADKKVTGVVIATPAETHYELAKKALKAGKHVYVEKPLVLTEAHGDELVELAKKKKLILMVGHLLQYHPAFIRLKQFVLNGELGRIHYIYSNRLNLGKIRREENILWSFAPHDISMILALTGEMPSSVMATGGNYLHPKIADVTTTHLEFPTGVQAHIFVSWLHPYKEQKLVVAGDKKMAVFNDTEPWDKKLLLYPHSISWENRIPVASKAEPEKVVVEANEPLGLECRQFLKCIQRGAPLFTDGEEGVRVLRVLNASQNSLNQNGKKIIIQQMGNRGEIALPSADIGQGAFIHTTAAIDSGCKIGSGTKIWHFAHVLKNSQIGDHCTIGQNVVVGPEVSIGNGCKVQNNVSVYYGVTLEDDVFCGPSMVFTNVYNPRAAIRRMEEARKTWVKKGATLGANCTIMCGITIGSHAFVGAGTVVLNDVPDFAMVVGNPGTIKGWMCVCGHRIHFDHSHGTCTACDLCYQKNGDTVKLSKKLKKGLKPAILQNR